jgi:hypothetical protein
MIWSLGIWEFLLLRVCYGCYVIRGALSVTALEAPVDMAKRVDKDGDVHYSSINEYERYIYTSAFAIRDWGLITGMVHHFPW